MLRSRGVTTSSSSPLSTGASKSKSRMHHLNTNTSSTSSTVSTSSTQRKTTERRSSCGLFTAGGLGVTLLFVLLYLHTIVSSPILVSRSSSISENDQQKVGIVRQQLRNFHRQIEQKQHLQHEKKETFQHQVQETQQQVQQVQETQQQVQQGQETQQQGQPVQPQQQQQQPQVQQVQQQTQQQIQQQLERKDLGPNECQYDGHCPVRSTCAAAAVEGGKEGGGGKAKGICQPFESKGRYHQEQDDDPVATESCAAACRTELELDEHFYQESWPEEELYEPVAATAGRPRGCLYVYVREPEGDRWKVLQQQDDAVEWKEVPPSVRNWTEHRFRHVIRVDPVNEIRNDDAWMAYCHNTCVTDVDCATTTASDGTLYSRAAAAAAPFTCQSGACQRNKEYWDPSDEHIKDENGNPVDTNPEMVIVTGATSSYMKGLTNLCASLRYWAPHHKVIVYNLGGMSVDEIHMIEGWTNVAKVEWRDGVPVHYPPHVSKGKIYAWKPIIVNETLHKYKSIFWLDAGSTVAGPITPIEEVIQKTGMMLVKGQDLDMKGKSFEATYQWFNTTKKTFQAGPHFSGNTQAFMLPSRYVESIVIPDAICAMDPNCITPPGAHLYNHRYDQTTISILAYMPKVRAPHYTEYLAASKGQLNPDMRKPSFKMIWTTRQSVKYFSDWEAGQDAPLTFERTLTS